MFKCRLVSILAASALLSVWLSACAPTAPVDGGVNLAAMDDSVRPGQDFYAYANGAWQRDTEIPADRSSIGAFYIAALETERQNTDLINGILNANPAAGSDEAPTCQVSCTAVETLLTFCPPGPPERLSSSGKVPT